MKSELSISVVIPLYNKAAYIAAALQSVLEQTRLAEEVIVVDDGSTDEGAAVAAAFSGVRVVRQPNGGVSSARNSGIQAARGDLVALLDADDLWLPNFLASVEELAVSHPDAGIVCTGYRRTSVAGPVSLAETAVSAGGATRLPSFYSAWARGSFACASSIALRRSTIMSLGALFPVGERLGEDQDVWFRMAEAAPVVHLAKACAEYRVDAANNSSGGQAVRDPLPCYRRLGERLAAGLVPAHETAGARKLLASHLINVARARAALGDRAGARQLLWTRQAAGNPVYWARSLLAVH